jgi:hypothetical protein
LALAAAFAALQTSQRAGTSPEHLDQPCPPGVLADLDVGRMCSALVRGHHPTVTGPILAVHAARCVDLRVSERVGRGRQDGCRLGLCPLDTEELESIDTWARGALRFVM